MAIGYKTVLPAALLLLFSVSPLGAVRVTTNGDTGLHLSITPGAYQVKSVTLDGTIWRSVKGLTAGSMAEEGRPDLPREGYWIGLPDGARAIVTVVDVEY